MPSEGVSSPSSAGVAADVGTCFSASYRQARQRFLEACRGAGASARSFLHPSAADAGGGPLHVDVARLGPRGAGRVLAVVSGTHGVEGFCGSGAQVACLRAGLARELPRDAALVLVHALNPYGFAHLRRVDQDNVDLNRNFVDHSAPHPPNPAYDRLHGLLVPADWDGPARAAADRELARLLAEQGARSLQSAIQLGQYEHPDGLFYGGRAPTWSNGVWRRVVEEELGRAERIALVDLHSGLGPYGRGELIFRGRHAGDGLARARAWLGEDVTSSDEDGSCSARIDGNLARVPLEALPGAEVTALTLEFGTVPMVQVLEALRADNWLHARRGGRGPAPRDVGRAMRSAFVCDAGDWQEQVCARALEALRAALRGLAAQ